MGSVIDGKNFRTITEDIEAIGKGSFVYLPFVCMEKTWLSQGCYEELGAIVVGTTDEEVAGKVHFVLMNCQLKSLELNKGF